MRAHGDITLGQSAKNTFSIPIEGVPRQFTMFRAESNGTYRLHFTKQMDGRISDGGQPITLSELKERGAEHHGDSWSWSLPQTARGKIEIGDCALLFQFVAEPPSQPKPRLPASVRGSLGDRINVRLSAIVALSVLLHASVVGYAMFIEDPDRPNGIAERAYNLTFKADATTIEVVQPPVQPGAQATATTPLKVPEKKSSAAPVQRNQPAASSQAPGAASPEKIVAGKVTEAAVLREHAVAFAAALNSEDASDAGQFGTMAARAPGSDLGMQIQNIADGNRTVQVGAGSGRSTHGDADPRIGTGKRLVVETETVANLVDKKLEKPTGVRIAWTNKPTTDDETSLSPEVVWSKVNAAYMSGLQRCYREYLKKDSSARGKIQISFTVNTMGRATTYKASGVATEVEACVTERMAGWTFPIPKDSANKATTAAFSLSLALVAE